ncbi:MAG: hypothetical protein IT236_07040 [Bacteroidia bacterium]|nr:hypothetical protein [Bacteroidia bacterium]
MNKLLLKFEEVFSLYAPFWEQWANYSFNGLNSQDIYLINAHRLHEFKFEAGDNLMFYNKAETVELVVSKLKSTYANYQEWVLIKFQFLLLFTSGKENVLKTLETPIEYLPLDNSLKEIIRSFKGDTLSEIFKNYSDIDFKSDKIFGLILKFKLRYNILNPVDYGRW